MWTRTQPWGAGLRYQPIAYGSKAMSPEQKKHGAHMQEIIAGVTFLENYLADKMFTVWVDNIALR